jgi:hypothetical protein
MKDDDKDDDYITVDDEGVVLTDSYQQASIVFDNIGTTATVTPSVSTVGTIFLNTTDSSVYVSDGITWTPLEGDILYNEAEELIEKQKQEEKLREKNPNVNEAWEHYQLMLKMCQDDEIDETTLFNNGVKND